MACLNHQKGSRRDSLIIETIEKHKCLNTEQVELLFFGDIKYSKQIAQRRLKRLTELKRLKRGRFSFDQPYHYFAERPGQIEHTLTVNWAYVWLTRTLKKWEHWHSFTLEQPNYGFIRSDALAAIKNTVSGKMRVYFIEADRGGNPFDKVAKYNTLYTTDRYINSWWVPLVKRFPAVIVVTTSETRKTNIIREIKEHNTAGLEFGVYLLSYIRKVCIDGQGDRAALDGG